MSKLIKSLAPIVLLSLIAAKVTDGPNITVFSYEIDQFSLSPTQMSKLKMQAKELEEGEVGTIVVVAWPDVQVSNAIQSSDSAKRLVEERLGAIRAELETIGITDLVSVNMAVGERPLEALLKVQESELLKALHAAGGPSKALIFELVGKDLP